MEFRILGPLEVLDDGTAVAVGGGKPRALLAALLLRAGEAVSTERLIDELWGDRPPETAVAALQVHVSQLRKALGRDVVVREGPGYAVRIDRSALDLARFEDLVAAARTLPAPQAAARLREALALWRGEPEVDAARLEELRLAALEARIDADLESGAGAELIPELTALVEGGPLRERLRAQLMLALYRAGRQADALAEYTRARAMLVDELGVEPGRELQVLQRAILAQDPALAAPARRSLPVPATELVGREREVEDVRALYDGGARLVTLTGAGGIGKTRLALEVVQRLDPAATWVPLASVDDAQLVPAAVAHALGLEVSGLPVEGAVDAYLREREAFLLLDNFEQLLDAASWVSSLLAAAPRLRVLVTSRAVLRVAGEREFEVPPLEDGAELFVRRAPAPVDDLDSVRAICARLDGLPLAIELAAARTKLLAPAALLERLESRLELLTAGTRDAPERQRTMRAAIDWSYRLLAPDEQVLFARLAVFAGDATLQAVEEVCGTGLDALETLASLVDKSLVRRRGDGEPAFGMLETLREYAAEQLRALGEEEALRARHLALHVELARAAEAGLEGPKQHEWLARLESALPDVRAALAHALDGADAEAAVTIAAGLRRFWHVHGHLEEGRRWLEAALASGDAPAAAVEKAWMGLGILLGDSGDLGGARAAFERSLALARELGEDERVASALTNLGTLAMFAGRYDDAERLYQEVLAVHRRSGSAHALAQILENLGTVALVRGDAAAAATALEEAWTHARALGEARAVSSAARWLARALVPLGELDRARQLLLESLELAERIGHRQGVACAVDFAAAWAAATGDPTAGARLLGAGAGLFASIGATRLPDVAALVAETEREVLDAIGAEAFEAEAARGRAAGPAEAVPLAREVLDGAAPAGG